MIGVETDKHYAAHRFGLVAAAGGKATRRPVPSMSGYDTAGGIEAGQVLEFRDAAGELLSRKVVACGRTECWLRADLADGARAALAREAAEHDRIKADLADFIKSTDAAGAKRNGVTVEQYRATRHAKGARWDRYRAEQRARG